jgi:hypothetical protein
MLFPLDIVSQIVKYFPVADATKTIVSLCPQIETESLEQIKNEHRDPNIFFMDIVAEVLCFMDLMRMTRAMLIGIRAFSYFHHVSIKSSHPWEFICPGDVLCWLPFIDHLESKGTEWDSIKQSSDRSIFLGEASSILGWIFSNGKRVPIQLTWMVTGRSQIETILDSFGMTPLQCAITGYEAIDPYGSLHSKKRYRLWQASNDEDCEYFPNVFEAMNICESSSIKPVSHDVHRNHDPYTRFRSSTRLYSEQDSIFINFDIHSHLPQSLFQRKTTKLPIVKMTWEEDAYRVKATSHSKLMYFSYHDIKSKWPQIALPCIDHEYLHFEDDSEMNTPDWTTKDEWIVFMSQIFDGETDNDQSEDEQMWE